MEYRKCELIRRINTKLNEHKSMNKVNQQQKQAHEHAKDVIYLR